jgi:hypothetical protein
MNRLLGTWLCLALSACTSGDGHGSVDAGGGSSEPERDATVRETDPVMDEAASAHARCERYITCAREAIPTGITPLIATYGSEGSCWELPGVKAEDCASECDAGREALFQSYEIAACGDCVKHSDCESGVCLENKCALPGVCMCPEGDPDCDPGHSPPSGRPCGSGEECSSGLVCASYQGSEKTCMKACKEDGECFTGLGCSPERDSEGRGLCITPRCTEHADCGQGNACRRDGTCGCRDDRGCRNYAVCQH